MVADNGSNLRESVMTVGIAGIRKTHKKEEDSSDGQLSSPKQVYL